MKLLIPMLLAALGLGALASVSAQNVHEVLVTGNKAVGETRSRTVNFADLDLSKSEGVKALLTRIRGAADVVCAPAPDGKDMKANEDHKKCVGTAVSGAVAKVNNSSLTAMAK